MPREQPAKHLRYDFPAVFRAWGFFTQIKEKLVGKSTKQNEKYVLGLDKSSETFSDRIMN